ncbi:LCP family protein [Nocardioides panacis]|uniref:LCP family protein n=1 Tax=Nocardioides panacis TaxID=2849501 RepID=A0A975XYX4_9ACTN|nr:LCP family protein [Nocardioides panacis]QWZ06773.1 LCP family protein [Nocardioides panacis]
MADRPGGNSDSAEEPGYDWLYGTRRRGVGGSPEAARGPAGADDPTQVQPVQPRPARAGQQRPGPRDPEPTQMLPTVPRPDAASSSRSAGRSGGPYETPPPARSRSTGSSGGSGGRRPVAPPPPSGPSRSRPRFRVGWLKYVLVLWLAFLVAVPLLAWSKIDKVDATPSGERPSSQPGTTYLLVGSDSREGLTRKQQLAYGVGRAEGRRTDTIMLLHTGSGPNMLMSIPRDSIVPVPGHGTTKINAAFAYGGPKLLVETVEQNTGIRVDDYVEIGFAGFIGVVDAVGGVRICPKQAMKDKLASLDIKKGCQEVQGTEALGYARSRHTSGLGDIARAQHQREVVSAVGAKAASPWTVLNPVRYYRLAMAGAQSLRVGKDTGMIATMRFAWAMTRVDGKNGLTCGVPISDLAVHWDPERSRRMFKLIQEDRTADISRSLCRQSGLRNQ